MNYIAPFLISYTDRVHAVLACSICFYGDPDEPANKALRYGIITLLAILLVVLGLFARFFISLGKRNRSPERGH